MERCRETAFCLALWYAVLTVIVAVLAIALHDLERSASLLVAANVALLFALVLIARAGRLTDSNVVRGQFWRTLPPHDAPARRGGRADRATCLARDVADVRQGRRRRRDRAVERSLL